MERRLSAILAADVIDYSRLMGEDEARMLAALKSLRDTCFEPTVEGHKGHIIKRMGDGWLVEFSSISDAVDCALIIQRNLAKDDAVKLRIGLHLGDVTFEGEDIFGDGVNIAARLEKISPPGGIAISDIAYNSLDNKTGSAFTGGESRHLKNISRDVQVWFWNKGTIGQASAPHRNEKRDVRPSIAVLPFINMSADPEQEYFADGITEDIITELSRFPDLTVFARGSTFVHKRQDQDGEDIARNLGADYIVEGSVRRSGQRLRITAQLTDRPSGQQFWAERYDGEVDDIFDFQDEITQKIVASVPERIEIAEVNRIKRARTKELSAYEYVIRGKQHHHKCTVSDNAEAIRLLDKAIDIDPEYAPAFAWKACTLGQAIALGTDGDVQKLIEENLNNVNMGLKLDQNDIECHRILSEFGMFWAEYDDAAKHHEKAFKMNPNDPRIIAQRGELMTLLGRSEEAISWIKQAMAVDPYNSDSRVHLLARAYLANGNYAEALTAYKRIVQLKAAYFAEMAAAAMMIDKPMEAAKYRQKALESETGFSISAHILERKFRDEADSEQLEADLSLAGLPE